MAINRTSPKKGKVVDLPEQTITIGTATAGIESASVAFTVASTPATGGRVSRYTAISNPGSITRTGNASPIVVTGLTSGSSYTFQVAAANGSGNGPLSAASNSITAITNTISADFLAVAGGGAMQSLNPTYYQSGGGGGGLRSSISGNGGGASAESALTFNVGTAYTITVGAGGANGNGDPSVRKGGNSSIAGSGFTTLTAEGGGGAGQIDNNGGFGAGAGGSGGGAGGNDIGSAGGVAVSPTQGFKGGDTTGISHASAGAGGGGAGSAGQNKTTNSLVGGNGGNAKINTITATGVDVYYAGGGAGAGGYDPPTDGANGTGYSRNANTGSGGSANGTNNGTGCSGVVILRALRAATATTGSPVYTTQGSWHIYQFNGNGTITY